MTTFIPKPEFAMNWKFATNPLLVTAFCVLLMLVVSGCLPVRSFAQTNLKAKPATQFGHISKWRTDFQWKADTRLFRKWQVEVGLGRSQVVGREDSIFITSADQVAGKLGSSSRIKNRITCLDSKDGKARWQYEFETEFNDEQETFGGKSPAPQSTPLLIGDRLVAISFTGMMVCLNTEDGREVWKKSLIEDFGAVPVQFGFSSSPVQDPDDPKRFVFLAAGNSGGLHCMNIEDGSIVWKAECQTFSYATPVPVVIQNEDCWVAVSENEVLGLRRSDGERLWRSPLREPGLTNVPTPLSLGEDKLLISGQGAKGTQAISINKSTEKEKTPDRFSASELWHQRRIQLFYTNWLMLDNQRAIACTDKYLAAFDTADGSLLARWRGYRDGNLLRAGNVLILLDGEGKMSVLKMSPNNRALNVFAEFEVAEARCWVPPTILGSKLYVRFNNQLLCLQLGIDGSTEREIKNQLDEIEELAFRPSIDPVDKIVETFSSKGQEEALKVYQSFLIRRQLSEEHFRALVEAARQQGDRELVKMLLKDAQNQFPNSKSIQTLAESLGK